jgi:pimeloyl-ACP methyl ester carboxylesterase
MFFGDQVSHLTASLKNFHYEVIAGAGHSPHRDKPQETLAALRALLT